ncbi:winged helix-turn-helix transcriptional regulator [Luteimonas gilva]|uniref:Winged helix-turn-helix transcriptional regulator n=1 Tax=Luteimonas gilva TaxID=2572684 RepID=A0A4U5K021_9GAMM|nr:MarR family winged helix-turn-helix transcriptional regulator [Luteimonas gilva]TKR33917.1 winged helix-turn-helix transcriptional regulator [Luteimonas gilva]
MAHPPPSAPTCTCFRLRKLSRLMSQRYDRRLAEAGLNINQYSLLRRAEGEPRGIGELAKKMGMDRTTLTRDLKPLIASGWIAVATGQDARRRVVTVTAAGKRAAEKARPLWLQAQQEIENAIGDAATQRLHAQLDAALLRLQAENGR